MKKARISGLSVLSGGDEGIRTLGPHVANVMLSQLSYIPTRIWRETARG